jgi:XTP/dITP diphosphohydrolase
MLGDEKNRKATAKVAAGFWDGEKLVQGLGEIKGIITTELRGETSFGWDSIFIPEGHNKTFAEMTMEEKNKISMRRLAFEDLRRKIL